MMKDAIHGHNLQHPGCTFHFLFTFWVSHVFSLPLDVIFNFLNMTIYRKEPRRLEKFAQASCYSPRQICNLVLKAPIRQVSVLLMTEETWLAQASWLLAWANEGLKSWKNNHFPFLLTLFLDLSNNHQNLQNLGWIFYI